NRKHGIEEISYPHPDLEPMLKDTYAVITYQEQVMQIARVMAGYTLGQADSLRKAMGKKKPELIQEHRQYFIYGNKEKGIPGAVNRGYSEELAKNIYDLIEYFAGYGFNRAHATCYAYISYQTAWLKTYYPKEFWTAVLSMEAESGNKDQVKKYVDAAREMGIEILPPDINESDMGFKAVPEGIRIGLLSINGLGTKILESIVANRPYEDFDDFVARARPNKTAAVNLIKAGAFDRFEPNRNKLLKHYFEVYRPKDKNVPLIPDSFTTIEQKRAYETETLGFILTLSTWEKTRDGAKVT
ncbi:MAG: DNA polymerase III subunit alpha, partial [Clostridia bacterium]|nr:DNA polymerase III subunit alpha [Clostridia bacterium]